MIILKLPDLWELKEIKVQTLQKISHDTIKAK